MKAMICFLDLNKIVTSIKLNEGSFISYLKTYKDRKGLLTQPLDYTALLNSFYESLVQF